MITTLINDPFEDDAVSILMWAYGVHARQDFLRRVTTGERVGQAFMNVLRVVDQEGYARLAGSSFDPFYVDKKIPLAIDKLTSK